MKVLPADAVTPIKLATHTAKVAATPIASALLGVAAIVNASVDMMYYDVRALTPAEFAKLSGSLLAQGTALIVEPGRGAERIDIMSGDEFIEEQSKGRSSIKTVAVPGVGSTSIAAAALARNVADTLEEPVAAIVPGYGAVDLLADACGGWYVLGANNALLDMAEQVKAMGYERSAALSDNAGALTQVKVADTGVEWPSPMALLLNEASEVLTLQKLFIGRNNLQLLVGHSKGCLSLAFALNAIARSNSTRLPNDLHVVTMGCVTYFPARVKTSQYLGELDMLGRANSRRGLDRVTLRGKMHSLNSQFPTSVNVAEVLRHAGVAQA
jgi:hypothetical protein